MNDYIYKLHARDLQKTSVIHLYVSKLFYESLIVIDRQFVVEMKSLLGFFVEFQK